MPRSVRGTGPQRQSGRLAGATRRLRTAHAAGPPGRASVALPDSWSSVPACAEQTSGLVGADDDAQPPQLDCRRISGRPPGRGVRGGRGRRARGRGRADRPGGRGGGQQGGGPGRGRPPRAGVGTGAGPRPRGHTEAAERSRDPVHPGARRVAAPPHRGAERALRPRPEPGRQTCRCWCVSPSSATCC
jgi:hypothetical protein